MLLPFRSRLTPTELADVAEAALVLGLTALGQKLITYAFDLANGLRIENVESSLAEVQRAALAADAAKTLSRRQLELLKISTPS